MEQSVQLDIAARYRDKPLHYENPETLDRVGKIKCQSPNGYKGTAIIYREKDGSLYAIAQMGSIAHTRHRVRYLPPEDQPSEDQPVTEQTESKPFVPVRNLSDDQVREIRRRRAEGERPSDLAREFDQNTGTITNVCRGETYKDVEQVGLTTD